MTLDPAACYRALVSRDARFDGRLFVGVTSTGIYCRPVCRVRTPRAANCRYFAHAAAAEAAGFRPCLRCRPERAPGAAPMDAPQRLAWAAAQRIEAGALDDGSLAVLAGRLGVTDRHLRRVFADAFGVAPVAFAQTQRLLLAKRLLAETALPITEVALAAGFRSLRRFNALFRERYSLAPGELRRAAPPAADDDALQLAIEYRPPFDWPRLLAFLARRCVAGVEAVADGEYRRSVRLTQPQGEARGWLAIRHDDDAGIIRLRVAPSLTRALPAVLAGVRRLCDTGCEPAAVAAALGPLATEAPGLRVPGAFDGFEMAVRAVLGQQVTVKAAHTLAGRLVAAFGSPLATPFADITHAFPPPARLAACALEDVAALGIVRQRATAILALARASAAGALDLGPAADVPATLARLGALPGIGPWTAQYIALRALAWPDAWPSGDVALIKALGAANAREADAMSLRWRPWRAYATLHLWRRLGETSSGD